MVLNKKYFIIAGIVTVALFAVIILFRAIIFFGHGSPGYGSKPANKPVFLTSRADEDAIIKNASELIKTSQDAGKTENAYWRLVSVYERRNDILKLNEIYRKLVEIFPSSENILKAQKGLADTNVKLLFSDTMTPGSILYKVEKGDNLVKIAKKFNTTVELIRISNNLKTDMLKVGQKLKICKSKFSIVVDKSQNILTLKADNGLFKTYRVSTGKNSSTPVGTFKITNKIIDPPWYQPSGKVIPARDPKNSLGSRWLGISKPSYGIHGTIDPDSIGQSVTEGCVRLKNADVEELYIIVPKDTEVVIVD